MINKVNSISFGAYVPVRYFVKDSFDDKYYPVASKENIRKCNSYVVRNLNGTAKNQKNADFVNYYKAYDSDYRELSKVHSVYDKDSPIVYLVSGSDASKVAEYARPIGIAKGKSIDAFGHAKSYDSKQKAKSYFSKVKNFIKFNCSQLKGASRKPITLLAYFDPVYDKKGEIKSMDFASAKFVTEENLNPQKKPPVEEIKVPIYEQLNIFDYYGAKLYK